MKQLINIREANQWWAIYKLRVDFGGDQFARLLLEKILQFLNTNDADRRWGRYGGALGNSASFCNVVGCRTSPGRVPVWLTLTGWCPISVQGPMACTVQEVALMLNGIAGPDLRSPISIAEPGRLVSSPLDRDFKNVKLAWSSNLGE